MSSSWDERWYGAGQSFAASALFAPLSLGFRAAVATRNALYDSGLLPATRIEHARVVSVGNLNVGGAGKTPVVIFLAQWALRAGLKVAVLSRGYGRTDTALRSFDASQLPPVHQVGDEPRLIARRCPGLMVWVGADRVELARRAVVAGAQLLLLDDGLQHRRLARDVDLVVVDGQAKFGNGHLLPWGPLREPLSSLRRASLLWVRGDAPLDGFPADRQVLARHRMVSTPQLTGAAVVALAGLARPLGFVAGLESLGARVVERRLFSDHHRYTAAQLEEVVATARRLGARVVTTQKDAERLPEGFDALAVPLEVEVTSGLEALGAALGIPATSPRGP